MEKLYIRNIRVGRKGEEIMNIEVKILNERVVYGRREVEITPAAGSGSWWINESKLLRLDPKLKAKVHV